MLKIKTDNEEKYDRKIKQGDKFSDGIDFYVVSYYRDIYYLVNINTGEHELPCDLEIVRVEEEFDVTFYTDRDVEILITLRN